jgi:carbonic anhydrase/acetyltransferase-like protein (isoleucine patch superfamily)
VGLGAIVVTEERSEIGALSVPEASSLLSDPLGYVDVLGRSTVERMIERFVLADVDVVTVIQRQNGSYPKANFTAFENVEFQVVVDTDAMVQQKLADYARSGIEHSFLVTETLYAETDLLDLFYFHREARQLATRAVDREGPLDLWVLDCAKSQDADLKNLRAQGKSTGNSYFIREYVNRLRQPADLRRFASDLLRGRCSTRPPGREVKRGIWIEDGAEVHRRARIVAPAYIGCRSKVMEDTLITRLSNVEKDCCVDYGSVVENSSILPNTEIGICLDVCHAIANGNKLLSLDRNVVIEISDPSVMHSNSSSRKPVRDNKWARKVLLFSRRKQGQKSVADLQPAASAPKQRRLQVNSV